MNFNDLNKKIRKVPNLKVLSVCTLILLRHKEVSSYSELVYKIYDVYIDATNYELYSYFCKKLNETYNIDITNLSLEEINNTLENFVISYCEKELDVAIAHSYLSELQGFKLNTEWTIKQRKIVDFLIQSFGEEFTALINPSMTNRTIIYIATIASCDFDLAQTASEYTLSDDVLHQICLGAIHGVNLLDFALQGCSTDDLALLNKAAQLPGFNIDNFMENGTPYPNITKVRNFIINY